MRWSKLKRQVEALFADSVAGRVELRLTSYRHAHDGHGRGWITIDGREVASMCYWSALQEGIYDVPSTGEPISAASSAGPVMPHYVFTRTLKEYLSLPVEAAIDSPNFLVRALATLDRRVGRRRLADLSPAGEHPLVAECYRVRVEADAAGGRTGRPTSG